jgi:hypothetical protein
MVKLVIGTTFVHNGSLIAVPDLVVIHYSSDARKTRHQPMARWENVYTVTDREGPSPLTGAADCGGVPHLYARVFLEAEQEYADEYRIMEIDRDLLVLLVESFQIFLRWRAAFDGRTASLGTHPALPDERPRHEALKATIGDRDRLIPEKSKLMRPRFKRLAEFEFEVMWEPVK